MLKQFLGEAPAGLAVFAVFVLMALAMGMAPQVDALIAR